MTPLGKLALIGFAALLVTGLMAGLARDFYSREQGRFEATSPPSRRPATTTSRPRPA